uniref:Uncharacterized protein n=1 Tax=Zea mays TaxID=4577 RepID=A0A804NFT1_MAIZE
MVVAAPWSKFLRAPWSSPACVPARRCFFPAPSRSSLLPYTPSQLCSAPWPAFDLKLAPGPLLPPWPELFPQPGSRPVRPSLELAQPNHASFPWRLPSPATGDRAARSIFLMSSSASSSNSLLPRLHSCARELASRALAQLGFRQPPFSGPCAGRRRGVLFGRLVVDLAGVVKPSNPFLCRVGTPCQLSSFLVASCVQQHR